jgi:chemotaxis protein methyltransferase CheR
MRITDFDLYRDLLKEKSGLILSPDQSYLLDSRLNPVAKKWGYASLDSMTIALQGVPDNNLVTDVVEAMMSHETSFFHHQRLFHTFKDKVLPYMASKRGRKGMKIWCAAASSGQEAYSLALLIREAAVAPKVDILATDLSNDLISQAREGAFSQLEVQRGLPVRLLLRYFTQQDTAWRINESVRKMVRFQTFNLLENMGSMGPFDVIFCCNILGSFERDTQEKVLARMLPQITKDGFLFLGPGEDIPSP